MKRLASIILGVAIILGAIRSYVLYRDSFPTPADALNDYITRITTKSHSPQKIESLNIVSSTLSNRADNEQLLLFQAYDRHVQTHIAGYATIKKSLFGWYVEKLQMMGRSPLPDDIMASLDWSEGAPVIYGQIFLANASRVEAIFSDPNKGNVIIRAEIPEGNFVLFGSQYSELIMFKILVVNGNVLKQFTGEELQNG